MNTLGVDIGGTKIFVGRYDKNLHLEAEHTVATHADKTKEVTLENLLKGIEAVQTKDTTRIGVAWAGFVDSENGRVIKAPNVPHLNDFALCDYVTEKTTLPCLIENDARAFAYGARSLVAPHSKMCLGIIIGTGVGSGLMYEGQIIRGANGYAGEIGHITRQNKEIEAWLAGPSLKKLLGYTEDTTFSEMLAQNKVDIGLKIEPCLAVFTDWLVGLILTFDADQIILGGGTAVHFWQHFETEIKEQVAQKIKAYPNQFEITFYNGDNAGAIGVAALSQQK